MKGQSGDTITQVIGKKTCSQIQAGDVIGLLGDHMHYSLDPVDRLTTVVSVEKQERINCDGQAIGKRYLITCSDGITYSITSAATKYRIYEAQVAS
jgi:hypothetical protein